MTQSAETTTADSHRFHALDAVRASALLLGVVFHAAESMDPAAITYWATADVSSSGLVAGFRHASHSFRMELFFLIAGFFAHLLWQRRGVGTFIRNRFSRILVPLVVGWMVLYPILVFLWITGASQGGRWEIVGIPDEARSMAPWKLTLGFFLSLRFLGKFDLTHLWFLHQLLVLYALALGLRAVVLRAADGGGRVAGALDRRFRRWMESPFRVVGFAALVWPSLVLQGGWGVGTPKESLLPDPAITLLYAVCFGVGWALHRQPGLLPACARGWREHLVGAVVLAVATTWGMDLMRRSGGLDVPEAWLRPAYLGVYALMMGLFVFGFLGLFLETCHGGSPVWRYLADASYWVYLVHLPLVVALQIVVSAWPLPWWIKLPGILLVTFPTLYLSYHALVRSTVVGVWLNGRRHPYISPWKWVAADVTRPPGRPAR